MRSRKDAPSGEHRKLEDSMQQLSIGIVFATMALAFGSLAACGDDSPNDGGGPPAGQDGGTANGDGGATPDTGAAGDGGSDSGSAGLGPGPYTLVYAGTEVGIDMRNVDQGKATFDGPKLLSYHASDDERPELGTNQVNDASGDAFIAIGRWSGGKTAGKFYEIAGTGLLDLPANGGFHYAIGNFTDPLPASGSQTYSELAKTVATVSDGSAAPGTVAGSLAATFAGADTKIGFSITLDVSGDATYTLATTGGTADVSTTEAKIGGGNVKGVFFTSLDITSAGGACTGVGTCSGAVYGFVAGPNADRIGLVAHVYTGSGGSPKSVAGAIVFKK